MQQAFQVEEDYISNRKLPVQESTSTGQPSLQYWIISLFYFKNILKKPIPRHHETAADPLLACCNPSFSCSAAVFCVSTLSFKVSISITKIFGYYCYSSHFSDIRKEPVMQVLHKSQTRMMWGHTILTKVPKLSKPMVLSTQVSIPLKDMFLVSHT